MITSFAKIKNYVEFFSLSGKSDVLLSFFIIASLYFSFSIVSAEENELSLKQMLLTPGDLTKAHADIETKCESCHAHFDKSNQTPLCLDCHKEIKIDLANAKGFHGRLNKQQTSDCKSCHTDHKGRSFDIRGFDQDNFDHSKTDFKLDGSHENIACVNCHNNTLTRKELAQKGIINLPIKAGFRFENFECSSCHIDFHEKALGDQCESCHNTKSWTNSQFEHDKTDFPLDGEHQELECSSCHINNQFEKLDTQCQSCHLSKEPHLGIFGGKCVNCHTTGEWKSKHYDHFKETGYELKDSHLEILGKNVKCIDCHSEKKNPETKCIGCHQVNDVHQGSNGAECQDCHNQKLWNKSDFIHSEASTGFVLLGAHKNVSCDSCHIPGTKRNDFDLIRGCIDCHQAIDPHFAKLGKDCGNCHQSENWQKSVRFNHDFTDFPLTASHQLLVCESCHLSSEFSDQSKKCISCHNNDDIHEQSLGDKCESCHDSSVWSHWQFEHQQKTLFPLNGAHQNLKCSLCHNNNMNSALKPDKDCYSCHRDDDIHSGGFGIDCQQCHSEEKFEDLVF